MNKDTLRLDAISEAAKMARSKTTDIHPMTGYVFHPDEDGTPHMIAMVRTRFPEGVDQPFHMVKLIAGIRDALRGEAACYLTEAYCDLTTDKETTDLARQLREDPFSSVRHTIIVFYVSEALTTLRLMPFGIGDDGLPVFDAEHVDAPGEAISGTIPAVLMKRRPPPEFDFKMGDVIRYLIDDEDCAVVVDGVPIY